MITGAITILGTFGAILLWWLQNRAKDKTSYRDAIIEAEKRKRDQSIDSWWSNKPPAAH